MTKIQSKFAIKVPVELAEARFSRAVSRDALFLLLELAAEAKPIRVLLEDVPGFKWLGEDRSKTRAGARALLKTCVAELSGLAVQINDDWQFMFDELSLENDVLTMRPSTVLMEWMVEPKRYGRVVSHEVMFILSPMTLRLTWFLAAYVNRHHRTVEVTLDQIRSILGIDGKYNRYSNLKSKVLDASFREYNEKFPRTYAKFSPVRRGRGGLVSSMLISIEDKKPDAPTPLPKKLPNENYLPAEKAFTHEEELEFLKKSQDIYGWVLPHFSVEAVLDALAVLNNDPNELQRVIWQRYTPHAHMKPDSWLKAAAWLAANEAAAAMPAVDPISAIQVDDWLEEMMRKPSDRQPKVK